MSSQIRQQQLQLRRDQQQQQQRRHVAVMSCSLAVLFEHLVALRASAISVVEDSAGQHWLCIELPPRLAAEQPQLISDFDRACCGASTSSSSSLSSSSSSSSSFSSSQIFSSRTTCRSSCDALFTKPRFLASLSTTELIRNSSSLTFSQHQQRLMLPSTLRRDDEIEAAPLMFIQIQVHDGNDDDNDNNNNDNDILSLLSSERWLLANRSAQLPQRGVAAVSLDDLQQLFSLYSHICVLSRSTLLTSFVVRHQPQQQHRLQQQQLQQQQQQFQSQESQSQNELWRLAAEAQAAASANWSLATSATLLGSRLFSSSSTNSDSAVVSGSLVCFNSPCFPAQRLTLPEYADAHLFPFGVVVDGAAAVRTALETVARDGGGAPFDAARLDDACRQIFSELEGEQQRKLQRRAKRRTRSGDQKTQQTQQQSTQATQQSLSSSTQGATQLTQLTQPTTQPSQQQSQRQPAAAPLPAVPASWLLRRAREKMQLTSHQEQQHAAPRPAVPTIRVVWFCRSSSGGGGGGNTAMTALRPAREARPQHSLALLRDTINWRSTPLPYLYFDLPREEEQQQNDNNDNNSNPTEFSHAFPFKYGVAKQKLSKPVPGPISSITIIAVVSPEYFSAEASSQSRFLLAASAERSLRTLVAQNVSLFLPQQSSSSSSSSSRSVTADNLAVSSVLAPAALESIFNIITRSSSSSSSCTLESSAATLLRRKVASILIQKTTADNSAAVGGGAGARNGRDDDDDDDDDDDQESFNTRLFPPQQLQRHQQQQLFEPVQRNPTDDELYESINQIMFPSSNRV